MSGNRAHPSPETPPGPGSQIHGRILPDIGLAGCSGALAGIMGSLVKFLSVEYYLELTPGLPCGNPGCLNRMPHRDSAHSRGMLERFDPNREMWFIRQR